MGGIFGGSSGTQTSTVVNEIPEWIEREGENLFNLAQGDVANRDYPLYQLPRLAPFTGDQMAGFDYNRANAGAWAPAFQAAFTGAGYGSQPVEQADISRYMNPFTQSVI